LYWHELGALALQFVMLASVQFHQGKIFQQVHS